MLLHETCTPILLFHPCYMVDIFYQVVVAHTAVQNGPEVPTPVGNLFTVRCMNKHDQSLEKVQNRYTHVDNFIVIVIVSLSRGKVLDT